MSGQLIQAGGMPLRPTTVNFHGDELQALKVGNTVWVSLRRLCDALGLDPDAQRKRLSDPDRCPWACASIMTVHDTSGRAQEAFLIDLNTLPMWLATITVGKIREELRPKLIQYQREAAHVLADHFLRGPGASQTRAVLGHWGARLNEYVCEAKRRIRIERPGEWIIATEVTDEVFLIEDQLIAACFPLDELDLPDGSMGRRYSDYRADKAWAGPVAKNFGLRTPNDLCPVVFPNVYLDAERPHFFEWLYGVYYPECFPDYLHKKIGRDKKKWADANIPMPRLLDVGIAAANVSRRLADRPAVLPIAMRPPAIGSRQADLFD